MNQALLSNSQAICQKRVRFNYILNYTLHACHSFKIDKRANMGYPSMLFDTTTIHNFSFLKNKIKHNNTQLLTERIPKLNNEKYACGCNSTIQILDSNVIILH